MRWDLEEIARKRLERADVGTPVDPEIVVDAEELEVCDSSHVPCERCRQGLLVGRTILVDETLRKQRRAFAIAHELGHWLLRMFGMPDTEPNADYLASALILPRDDFERDLRRYGWDLIALCARHRFASFEAVMRRIIALREARGFVFDKPLAGQRKAGWYSVPYGLRPGADEWTAAREAVACGAPVEIRTGLIAWPVLEHDWQRVIVLGAV